MDDLKSCYVCKTSENTGIAWDLALVLSLVAVLASFCTYTFIFLM